LIFNYQGFNWHLSNQITTDSIDSTGLTNNIKLSTPSKNRVVESQSHY